jgi:hypothetical protein
MLPKEEEPLRNSNFAKEENTCKLRSHHVAIYTIDPGARIAGNMDLIFFWGFFWGYFFLSPDPDRGARTRTRTKTTRHRDRTESAKADGVGASDIPSLPQPNDIGPVEHQFARAPNRSRPLIANDLPGSSIVDMIKLHGWFPETLPNVSLDGVLRMDECTVPGCAVSMLSLLHEPPPQCVSVCICHIS